MLVAIAIPAFTSQLEKAREGVDAANIRSAYAEVMAGRMGAGNQEYYKKISDIKQKKSGWITANDWPVNLYTSSGATSQLGTASTGTNSAFKPKSGDTVYVVSAREGKAYVSTSDPGGNYVDVDSLG